MAHFHEVKARQTHSLWPTLYEETLIEGSIEYTKCALSDLHCKINTNKISWLGLSLKAYELETEICSS